MDVILIAAKEYVKITVPVVAACLLLWFIKITSYGFIDILLLAFIISAVFTIARLHFLLTSNRSGMNNNE